MKTLRSWVKSNVDLDEFLNPCDVIDETLSNYIGEIVPPAYCSSDFVQGGDAVKSEDGVLFYMTVFRGKGKYIYLGILPEFLQ